MVFLFHRRRGKRKTSLSVYAFFSRRNAAWQLSFSGKGEARGSEWIPTDFAEDEKQGYTLGLPTGREREMETHRISQRLNMGDYLTKRENGLSSLSSVDMVELSFDSLHLRYFQDIFTIKMMWYGSLQVGLMKHMRNIRMVMKKN